MIHQSTGPAREGLEEIIFNMRAKLFIFVRDSYEWTPHCVGDVMLLKHKKNRKTSLVMRDEKTFKVCASHYIFPHMDLSPSAGSDQGWVWDVEADISNGDPQAVTLAIHFEDSDKANAFKDAFTNAQQDNAPLFPYLTSQGLPCWL
ncbi:hypothetical protein K432DRAFT_320299 [Lepidopterella palustris CBS 459.81]|uniref:RanBD1 domain-containing protein n=1 Tax=Lepidopterella palustris CBS 459.81 TaxID=1314670 RepID=A0A8E2EI60_9PEZI|nr:hypothetical protein K432DRAFT_320299 [Lepidopterella palustris CBS 459.81]